MSTTPTCCGACFRRPNDTASLPLRRRALTRSRHAYLRMLLPTSEVPSFPEWSALGRSFRRRAKNPEASELLRRYLSTQHRDNPEEGCPTAALVLEVSR